MQYKRIKSEQLLTLGDQLVMLLPYMQATD